MDEYKQAALKYRPERIKVLFIAESPPAYKHNQEKSYFYFENNPRSDILFATISKALYDINYRKSDRNKLELLERLKRDGYWLIDAVERPINRIDDKITTEKERGQLIREEIPTLLLRLDKLQETGIIDPETGIILIKKIVFNVLFTVLSQRGFNVLNDSKIDFPKYYNDRDTISGIRKAL